MKKNEIFSPEGKGMVPFGEILKIMKVFTLIMLVAVVHVSAITYSQNTRLSLNMKGATIKAVLSQIEEQTEFRFLYSDSRVNVENKVDVNFNNKTVEDVLRNVFEGTDIQFKLIDRQILLSKKGDMQLISQQQRTITGKVTDSMGASLPGVTIVVKGTTRGTITDGDGNYDLNSVPENAVLVFSFVGMKSQEIPVAGKLSINVVMQEDAIGIEEVVAIGYGEVRKRDLTGSVTKVMESENIAGQYSSVDALLQGRAAGVQVAGNSGNPGQGNSVRIRGLGTLSGKSEPLYVIDGIIVNSAGEDAVKAVNDGVEYQAEQNGLFGINPRDIERIEILKDASATAIYGSRGSNGVVLITTKAGKTEGKAQINVFSSVDISNISKVLDVMDGITYAKYRNELNANKSANHIYSISGNQVYPITYTTDPDTGEEITTIGDIPYDQYNWQKEIYEMGINRNYGLTINAKNDKTNYYFSAGFTDQNGIVKNSEMKSGNIRLNLNQSLSAKLKLDFRISANYMDLQFAHSGQRTGLTLTSQLLRFRPLINESVESIDWDNDVSNPYAWVTDFDDLSKELRLYAVTNLEYEIIKDLKYKFQIGIDYRDKERSRWYGTSLFRGSTYNGDLGVSNLKRYSYTINNLLNFNKVINKIHRINAVTGFTYDASNLRNSNYEVGDFPIKSLRTKSPQSGQLIISPLTYSFSDESIVSGLLRINYSLLDKYLVTTTFRADGSSKFTDGNKWGYFPSVALAWNVEEESFIKNLKIFDRLKLRAGWGSTGNQSISPYSTLNRYNTGFYSDITDGNSLALSLAGLTNPDLTWETTNQTNIGVDILFWKQRVNMSIDAYSRNTKDLLQNMPIGGSNGFGTIPVNLGEISNKGIEFTLNVDVVDKKDLGVSIGGNIAFNRNKIQELGLTPTNIWINGEEVSKSFYYGDEVSTGSFKQAVNIFMEDNPIAMFWGYKTNGIYQTEEDAAQGPTFKGNPNAAGDMVFVDLNQDGNVNDVDKTFVGNPNPDFTYGFNLSVNYKSFTFSALFEGSFGNDITNANLAQIGYPGGSSTNSLKEPYIQAWRQDAPSTTYPSITWNYNTSEFFDRMVEDGSYLRLNNITAGYDFNFKNRIFKKLNVHISAKNLFTLTNYNGYDPVVTSYMYSGTIMGVDWMGTPNVKTYLIGASITF